MPLLEKPSIRIRKAIHQYRGTSLIRNRPLLGPYRKPMPRVLGWSLGGVGVFAQTQIAHRARDRGRRQWLQGPSRLASSSSLTSNLSKGDQLLTTHRSHSRLQQGWTKFEPFLVRQRRIRLCPPGIVNRKSSILVQSCKSIKIMSSRTVVEGCGVSED